MPAQKKTSLGLNQWIGSEYPKRIDFVEDNKIINDELENRVKYIDLAEENKAGIITYAKIKEIAPKPDLSPYVRFDSSGWNAWHGRSSTSNNEAFLKGSYSESWGPGNHHMYRLNKFNDIDAYVTLHVGTDRLYYRHNKRNGNNFVYFIDNLDMVSRDNNIQYAHTRITETWNKAAGAWDRTENIYWIVNNDTVREIRLVGHIACTVMYANQATEREGYVVTSVLNTNSDHLVDVVTMRALQARRGGGGQNWYNTPFG